MHKKVGFLNVTGCCKAFCAVMQTLLDKENTGVNTAFADFNSISLY